MITCEVTITETLVRYIIYPDVETEIAFRVGVEPIEASIHISVIRENYLNSICITIRVFYETTIDVQVTLTWL